MNGDELKVGDQVKLKSGGPVMTVTDTKTDVTELETAWFCTEQHTFKKAKFPPGALVKLHLSKQDVEPN